MGDDEAARVVTSSATGRVHCVGFDPAVGLSTGSVAVVIVGGYAAPAGPWAVRPDLPAPSEMLPPDPPPAEFRPTGNRKARRAAKADARRAKRRTA